MQVNLLRAPAPLSIGVRLFAALVAALLLLSLLPSDRADAAPAAPEGLKAACAGNDCTSLVLIGPYEAGLTWGAVTGATSYTLQYSTSSTFKSATSKTATTNRIAIIGLKNKTKYYVRVKVSAPESSAYSKTYSFTTKTTFGTASAKEIANVNSSSIEFNWVNVTGAPAWRVKAVPQTSGHKTVTGTSGTNDTILKGLDKATKYRLYVAVEQPAGDGLPGIQLGAWSGYTTVTTSNYSYASPADLTATNATPSTVDISWTAPPGIPPTDVYRVQYALNASMKDTLKQVWTAAGATSFQLTGLSANTQYYVRVQAFKADQTADSDRSDYALAKSRVPFGKVSGTVTDATGGDVVVAAFQGGDMIAQTAVASNGTYSLQLRPGNYRLKAMYVGTRSNVSRWVSGSAGGHQHYGSSAVVTVVYNQTTTVSSVSLKDGADLTGKVYYADTTTPIGTVHVAALTESEREVVAVSESSGATGYRLRGLEDGRYILRFNYPGAGFVDKEVTVAISGGADATSSPHLDLDSSWSKPRIPWISGTKRVGVTVKSMASASVAELYPVSRATTTRVRWLRNGTAITDWCRKTTASSCSLKLTSSMRGSDIQVQSLGSRYGYVDISVKSRKYRIR